MDRLVDADKLKVAVEGHEVASVLPLNDYEYGYNSGIERAVIEIEDAETADAIPVDWLLRKADWCDKNNGIFVGGAIRSAVDAWREEQNNGTDKS